MADLAQVDLPYVGPERVGSSSGGNSFFDWRVQHGIAVIRRLEAWSSGSQLDAIKMTWTDESSVIRGHPAGPSQSLTFEPGEKWKTLKVGKDVSGQRAYPANVGGGILLGMLGRAGNDIDCLGPLFIAPLQSITSHVTYINPTTGKTGIETQTLRTFHQDNLNGNTENSWRWSESVEKVQSRTWSQSVTFTFGVSVSITARIPKLAEIKGGTHWQMSDTGSRGGSTTESRKLAWDVNGKVLSHTALYASAITQEGKAKVNYISEVVFEFKNGRTAKMQQEGIYEGIEYTSVNIITKDVKA
ncbi:hypothetical protein FQN49_005772 [Arthroderma sp. PD_2]|nr:hypothetical protein FQN49_005772 [Arthroderma sp. PD_2]